MVAKKYLAVATVALLGATMGMSACSGSGADKAEGQVTWATWGTPDELKAFEAVNDEFRKNNPDVSLTFQPVASYSEYHSKLTTQLTSGTAPDVFYVGDDRIATLVANDVLEPIDTCLGQADAKFDLDQFNPEIYQIAQKDGATYALPNDVNPDAYWYDKEALAAAGITEDPADLADKDQWTIDKFFEMTQKMTDAGLTGAAFWNYWSTWQSILSSNGTPAYSSEGQFVGDDPKAAEGLQNWADRFKSGELVVADVMPAGADADTNFVTHKLGFLVQGRYTVATVEGAGQDMANYDVVRWPTVSGAEEPAGVAASFLAVNKNATDKEAACKFFNTFLSSESQTIRLSGNGNALPSIDGIDNIVTDAGRPANVAALLEMREFGFSNNPLEAAVPGLSDDIAKDVMLPLYQGKIDAATALTKVATMVNDAASAE